MIFSNASLIESEKERNLCTKFFAGYFFNEFTAGYAKRIVQFNRYLQEVTGRDDLALQSPNVSFDTHAYLCHERLRSKLSDVLVSDPARQVFLFIETKYLSNWSYAADVAKAQERLDKIFDAEKKPHLAGAKPHYFVLTSKRKEEAAGRPGANPRDGVLDHDGHGFRCDGHDLLVQDLPSVWPREQRALPAAPGRWHAPALLFRG